MPIGNIIKGKESMVNYRVNTKIKEKYTRIDSKYYFSRGLVESERIILRNGRDKD